MPKLPKVEESKYFFCEKFGKQIAKLICINRQETLERIGDLERLHNCRGCEQGKLILQESKKGENL